MSDIYFCPNCLYDFESTDNVCPKCDGSDAYIVDEEYLSDSDGTPNRMKDDSPMLMKNFCNDPDPTFYDLTLTVGDPRKGEFCQYDRVRISNAVGESVPEHLQGRTGTFIRYYLPKRDAVVMVDGMDRRVILPPECLQFIEREESNHARR